MILCCVNPRLTLTMTILQLLHVVLSLQPRLRNLITEIVSQLSSSFVVQRLLFFNSETNFKKGTNKKYRLLLTTFNRAKNE